MKRSLRALLCLAFLVGALGCGLSFAQGPSSPDAYATLGLSRSAGRDFFDSVQRAIKDDDRKAIASLVRYPLFVFDKSGHKRDIGRDQLMKEFGSVFSAHVKSAILCQSFDKLMVSNKGVMFANGTLWADVSSAGTGLEIVTLNDRAAHTVSCDAVAPK